MTLKDGVKAAPQQLVLGRWWGGAEDCHTGRHLSLDRLFPAHVWRRRKGIHPNAATTHSSWCLADAEVRRRRGVAQQPSPRVGTDSARHTWRRRKRVYLHAVITHTEPQRCPQSQSRKDRMNMFLFPEYLRNDSTQ